MMGELGVIVVILSAAISVGVTGIAAAWAEKHIGSAAVGAMAEKEELFGKGLVLTVIPETIVIFGLTVALVLLFVVLPQVL
jgi:V/A-type H+-transporting ATPase subunit K